MLTDVVFLTYSPTASSQRLSKGMPSSSSMKFCKTEFAGLLAGLFNSLLFIDISLIGPI